MKKAQTLALRVALAFLPVGSPALAGPADDRFMLRVGAMHAEGSGALFGSSNGLDDDASFRKRFDLGDKEISPRVDGAFRISRRQRLVFDYFRYEKAARAGLDDEVAVGDDVIPAGTFAKGEASFQLASLIYDVSVIDSGAFSAGVQIGAEYARLEGELRARAGDASFRASGNVDGYAPVVGLRLTATPSERWLLSAQAQYLDAGWGSFDFDGSIERANAAVEYRLTEMLGVFAGYDYFKVDYSQSGRDANGAIDLKFSGPMAGVSFAF